LTSPTNTASSARPFAAAEAMPKPEILAVTR
jgi:hypothetical protein